MLLRNVFGAVIFTAAASFSLPTFANDDGLAVAFSEFKSQMDRELRRSDQTHQFGFSHNPVISTQEFAHSGFIRFDFRNKIVNAEISSVTTDVELDLWLMKNNGAQDGSVRAEVIDFYEKVGEFSKFGSRLLIPNTDFETEFDWDYVLVTPRGIHPQDEVLAAGARTLFEKRYYRDLFGQVSINTGFAKDSMGVATNDSLVQQGADLFFNETFGGNGRTCGTCHRADNNLTIDVDYIAKLPDTDPLFVHEFIPALETLESKKHLRDFGLIKENVDGFDDLDNKFVFRSVNHMMGLAVTANRAVVTRPSGRSVGWSGDGAPGRGTLNEFVFGAINQHFPKTLDRVSGVDFTAPRQDQVDAIEAFQLSIGQQKNVSGVFAIAYRDEQAQAGQELFLNRGCVACHSGGFDDQSVHNTGVNNRFVNIEMPFDDGSNFGRQEAFNSTSIINAADTAPFFHNNSAATIEDAIRHYQSDAFEGSPAQRFFRFNFRFDDVQVAQVAAFLRSINALDNMELVRNNFDYIALNPELNTTELVKNSRAELTGLIEVLQEQQLYPQMIMQIEQVINVLDFSEILTGADKASYFNYMSSVLLSNKDFIMLENPADSF